MLYSSECKEWTKTARQHKILLWNLPGIYLKNKNYFWPYSRLPRQSDLSAELCCHHGMQHGTTSYVLVFGFQTTWGLSLWLFLILVFCVCNLRFLKWYHAGCVFWLSTVPPGHIHAAFIARIFWSQPFTTQNSPVCWSWDNKYVLQPCTYKVLCL